MQKCGCYSVCPVSCCFSKTMGFRSQLTQMMIKAIMAVFLFSTCSIQSINASPSTTHNTSIEEHGEDYIVQGLNLKKLEDKLNSKRTSYVQRYPLATYPWMAIIKQAKKLVIWTHPDSSKLRWPMSAPFSQLVPKYVVFPSSCSAVLILPKVLLTSDHCFWSQRVPVWQYWQQGPRKHGMWKLYKDAQVLPPNDFLVSYSY